MGLSTSQSGDKAIVLLSGGLDSTVALAKAVENGLVHLLLTFSYGQRAAVKELEVTAAIASHYGLPHRVIQLPWLEDLLPVALQAKASQEEATIGDSMAVKTVWVPNRNGVFLNIAASLAEAYQVNQLIFGANADEAVDFPDNTQAYRDALILSLAYSTLNQVRVITPVGSLSKTEIIQEGIRLKAPLHLIWSCYHAGYRHCGQCASCIRLKQAIAGTPVEIFFA